jgi:hypothetical protein
MGKRDFEKNIYGPTYENAHWRIKVNSELESKYKSQDIVSVIKVRILEWLGLIIRMNETGTVKKISEEKLEGRRGRGRPRLRWIDDVEDDLRNMGIKRWRIKVLDRAEWASVIKEAKAKLKGPQCYRKIIRSFISIYKARIFLKSVRKSCLRFHYIFLFYSLQEHSLLFMCYLKAVDYFVYAAGVCINIIMKQ